MKTLGNNVELITPEEAKQLHLEQQEIQGDVKFEPTQMKKASQKKSEHYPYVKVKTSSDNSYHDEDIISQNSSVKTDAHSDDELPTIKTDIKKAAEVPIFENVQVKSKIGEKVGNRIGKAGNRIGGLVELADSKDEF